MRELRVGVFRAPLRMMAEFLHKRVVEHLGKRIPVFERPPIIGRRIDALHDFGADFLGEERDLVGDHQFHLRQNAELLGLLDRQHGVVAPVHVDQHVGAGVGDVGQVELKSGVPSGETWLVTMVQPPLALR